MNRYPDIGDHGLIGDLQTAALVSGDGTVDWFCCPRFDSPSVFASLLDAERGGHFRIAPEAEHYVTRQLYFPDTAMLITRFMTPEGVGEVVDFMPVAGTILVAELVTWSYGLAMTSLAVAGLIGLVAALFLPRTPAP